MWSVAVGSAMAAGPVGDAAVDALAVGGGALVGAVLTGFPIAAIGSSSCSFDLGRSNPCADAAGIAATVGLVGGGIGGAALGAIPARVRSGRVAVAGVIPGVVGAGLLVAGGMGERDELMWAGFGTLLVGTPIAAAIAAATDRQDRDARDRQVGFVFGVAPAPGGGQLAVGGRF